MLRGIGKPYVKSLKPYIKSQHTIRTCTNHRTSVRCGDDKEHLKPLLNSSLKFDSELNINTAAIRQLMYLLKQ